MLCQALPPPDGPHAHKAKAHDARGGGRPEGPASLQENGAGYGLDGVYFCASPHSLFCFMLWLLKKGFRRCPMFLNVSQGSVNLIVRTVPLPCMFFNVNHMDAARKSDPNQSYVC